MTDKYTEIGKEAAKVNGRKIHYIDVSKMSEKELAKLLNMQHITFYKSLVLYGILLISLIHILVVLLQYNL